MEKMKMELSPDLVEEILCRVPATYLKRLRSTCKPWNRLIKEDRRFQKKHFEKAAKQFLPLLLRNDFRIYSVSANLHREVKIEKLSLIDPHFMSEFDIDRVFHCDGLLLCTSQKRSTMLFWNPLTGEIKWIQPSDLFGTCRDLYLGYSKDNKSGKKSYKFLCEDVSETELALIYDLDSDSWKTVDDFTQGWASSLCDGGVTLKGNSYWIVTHDIKKHLGISLLGFDFSTEKSQPVPLPYQSSWYEALCLSVVRDEKLSVLVQLESTSKTEIWVTNKIDEITKAVSWTKLFALDLSRDLKLSYEGSFFLDEEKKVVMCCDRWVDDIDDDNNDMVYIVGEDNKVTSVELGLDTYDGCWPAFLYYSPSLVQIKRDGCKRKRGD
ncbi:F-box protein ETP2 [Cardamine amara subsp. amara]|uniref:F-box protein ETP2 n=1 Tax=Cardamine amara subsp. amara TaxID=228776 RepID=A0ABD1BWP0_CARAN